MAASASVTGEEWEERATEFLKDATALSPRASMRIESFKGCVHPLVVALQQRAAHTQVAEAVHKMTLDELISPVDEFGRTILHAAALFNSQAVCIAALTAHHAEIEAALEDATASLRMAAVERGCAVTPSRAHLVVKDLRAALARGDDVYGRRCAPSLASLNLRRRLHIVHSMDKLQRLALLAKERGAQVLLRAADAWGRTPLHYAAAARGRTVPVLLNPPVTAWHAVSAGGARRLTPSADWRAVGRGRFETADPGSMWKVLGLTGGRLFPRGRGVDVATGHLAPAGGAGKRESPQLPLALHRLVSPLGAQLTSAVLMTAASEGGVEGATGGGTVPAPASAEEHLHSCAQSSLGSNEWLLDVPSDAPAPFHTVSAAELREMRRQLGNVHDLASCTPLHYAAARGDVSAVQLLLAAGADASVQNTDGGTPLDVAKTQVVRRALAPLTQAVSSAVAPAVAQFAEDGSTAVFDAFAASMGGGASQEQLPLAGPFSPLRGGGSKASLGGRELGGTLTMLAQQRTLGSGTLHTLADFGLNLNTPTGPGLRTPLHLAAAAGDEHTARMLLGRGAEVDMCDAAGCTALHIAARNACGGPRFRRVAALLLQAGANPQATSSTRATPLHCAAALARDLDCGGLAEDVAVASHLEYKEWRAQHIAGEAPLGSTVAPPSSGNGGGAMPAGGGMSRGRRAFYAEATRMLGVLAGAGALLDAVDHQGRTPLHLAAAADKPSAVDVLLRLGAYQYARDIYMNTPLHLAAQHGAWRCVRLMAQMDAEFGVLLSARDSSGRYPFQVAKDAHTRLALTSLWEAAAAGSLDIVSELLSKQAQEAEHTAEHEGAGTDEDDAAAGSPRSAPGSQEHKDEPGQRAAELPPAPWLAVRPWSATRVLRRSPLHCLVTGAAAALSAQRQARGAAAKVQPRSGGMAPEVAAVLQTTGGTTSHSTRVSPWLAGRSPVAVNKASGLRLLQDIDHPDTAPAAPASANVIAGVGLHFTSVGRGALKVKDTPPPPTGRLLAEAPTGRAPADPKRTAARPASLVIRQRHLVPAVAHVSAAYTTSSVQRSATALASQASSAATSDDEGETHDDAAQQRSLPVALNARARTVHPDDVRVEKRFMRVAQRLLAAGASPTEADADGVTPLMLAARFGLTLLFATLLQGGEGGGVAALHCRDSWGNSALHWACAFKQAHLLLVAQQVCGRQLHGCVDDAEVWANHRQQGLRAVWGAGAGIAPKSAESRLTLRQAPTKSKRLGVSAPV